MTFDEWYAPWRHPGMTEDELSVMDRCRAAWGAAVAAQREKDAQVAEADLNPCPMCGLGGTPDHRARGIAAAIREGGKSAGANNLCWSGDEFGPQANGWFVYRDLAGRCFLCLSEQEGDVLNWATGIPPGGWDGEWLGPLPEGKE